MNPVAMAVIILSLVGAFLWSAHNRWGLLRVGDRTHESRFDQVPERLGAVWTFAFFQKKMRYYLAAGLAHQLIFLGFAILLLRTLILWGRGFDPTFNLWLFGPEQTLGQVYSFLKDVVAVLVLSGVSVFVYYRVIRPQQRMTLGWEGLLILGIIATMMLSDIVYDGAAIVLNQRYASECVGKTAALCGQVATVIAPLGAAESISWHPYPEPAGSLAAVAVAGVGTEALVVIAHAGFWTHSTLVLVFLNILPYSKHFHIITAVPNVFFSDLSHPGRLRPIAKNTEELMAMVEKATEREDMSIARIGYARIEHFSWKDVLDFYTCTECGRCSDNCPAHTTGKILSPKHLTLDLRDHLYARQEEFLELGQPPRLDLALPAAEGAAEEGAESTSNDEQSAAEAGGEQAEAKPAYQPVDVVPNVVHPDVLWACTTCRACEEQCPVMITYVDKIVQMRRNLVIIKGEFPGELSKPFEGMEVNGNPWNLSRMDRATWTEGLEIKTFSEKPDAEVLYWVGCAASYDDRAKKVARATAELLTLAGVDFAILGEEETCTGDPARRAGNEYLFTMLAEANIATIDGYKEQGGVKTVLTTCPHCFNTLLNEYPDFGGKYEVVHHTDYLLGLVAQKKLSPKTAVKARVAYHDSCYLGRYNDVYESPRELLAAIPGVELVEVDYWTRNKGLCCGAGGAQMWMEEQNKDRVNVKRIKQLMDTGATTVASACPFCMTMLTDGIKNESKEESVKNLDVVELLAVACGVGEARAEDAPRDSESKSDGEPDSGPTTADAEAEQEKVEDRDAEPT
ncbi:MAG: (Fe-S)-binding protein [Polyangiaceae bacterium]|nr:(Fe-S)-binding protein [Polyangiaceae bacterium]